MTPINAEQQNWAIFYATSEVRSRDGNELATNTKENAAPCCHGMSYLALDPIRTSQGVEEEAQKVRIFNVDNSREIVR